MPCTDVRWWRRRTSGVVVGTTAVLCSTESSVANAALLAARWGLGTVPTAPDVEGDELTCTVTTAHGLAVQVQPDARLSCALWLLVVDNLKLC